MTGYYDSIRASTGIDPVTGVVYTAGQRLAYAGLAAAGFIPIVGWAGRAIKGGKGIYATAKGVKAANTSLDMYKTANALSSVKNVEMGIYGLASANGVSEYITGKDVFGTELNAEQRSASLAQGIFASFPFVPSIVSKGNYISKQTMRKISNMNLPPGSNTFQPFSQNQGALQKWLGNSQLQPAFAGNVPEVPMRVMDNGLTPKITPYKSLSRGQQKKIKEKIENRTVTKEEFKRYQWDRRFSKRRATGFNEFWKQEKKRILDGEPATRDWTNGQMQEILKGKKPKYNGHSIIGHHTYNAMNYPHISNRGELIYPLTGREHLKGWHGGSYSKNAPGRPVNRNYLEEF